MDEVELKVLEIEGKRYFLLDTLLDKKNTYYYFSNMKDNQDVVVLKDGKEDNFVSLDSERETDYALSLFYEKYKKVNNKNTN